VAHYAGIDLAAAVSAHPDGTFAKPYIEAGVAIKAGRRWLGIARRSGSKEEFAWHLARVVLAVHALANELDIDIDQAIADKVNVIFSRGWREVPADVSNRGC
jgi:NTP pyrophosphatase (non-canonical NTP hydrolase)